MMPSFKFLFLVLATVSWVTVCVTTSSIFSLSSRFCSLMRCPKPDCLNPIPADPRVRRCCPTCPYMSLHVPSHVRVPHVYPDADKPPLDCRYIRCEKPNCPNPIPPANGECCYTCPTELLTLDCRLVHCAVPECSNPIFPAKGQCCFTCPRPTKPPTQDCQLIRCAMPECSNPIPPAKGECCFTCPIGCRFKGQFYEIGSRFPAGDGCNKCFCGLNQHVFCTEKTCAKMQCRYNGMVFELGQTFPSSTDDCNKCTCSENGLIVCTEKTCESLCPVKGQVFTSCGSACPPNCTNLNPSCTRRCVPRCECPEGTIIDAISNSCVTECPCPLRGQRFTSCGSACPPNCTNLNPSCSRRCVPRCECPKGTIIDVISNTCVTVAECPVSACPVRGQVFTTCGSACPSNCTNPNPSCAKQCMDRCECPKGTVIDVSTNTCVTVDECPDSACPVIGQAFTFCGSACPPNCTIPSPTCSKQCVVRCECPEGTVIDITTNSCVTLDDCPVSICSVIGQDFTLCGSACPPDCTNPNPSCIKQCVPRCECPEGTVVDITSNSCVTLEECPNSACPVRGQVFTSCGSACPPDCTNPNPSCIKKCVPRCECPKGTVIDATSNSCVALDQCPSSCPPKKPAVNCFVDPCMFTKCPSHPGAMCKADVCGGCNARFFKANGNEITDSCVCPVQGQVFTLCGSACPPNCTIPNPSCDRQCVARCECPEGTIIDELSNSCVRKDECSSTCPPDKPIFDCFVDPCMFTKCPSHSDATCKFDFCGGCNARFYKANGKEVTDTCVCPVKGQIFTACGSACPPNCTTPHPVCTAKCIPRCQCPQGTVINEKTRTCVPVKKCPNECPFPQVFNKCGSACKSIDCTSIPIITPSPGFCSQQCVPRCECPAGKLFDRTIKRCVWVSQCRGYSGYPVLEPHTWKPDAKQSEAT